MSKKHNYNNENNMPPGKNTKNTQSNATKPINKSKSDVLTEEEIKKLPLRDVSAVGGKQFFGYYDEANLCIYFVDDSGKLTGQRGKLKNPLPKLKTVVDEEQDDKNNDSSDTVGLVKDTIERTIEDRKRQAVAILDEKLNNKKKNKEPSERKSKKWKRILIVILIIIACLVGAFFGGKYVFEDFINNTINDITQAPKEGEIMVIEVKNDIIPGDEITENNLKAANIDSQTYNQIAINGNDLYRWEQKDNIVGMYATEYISQGHYVTANAVTKIYKEDDNPWEIEDNDLTLSVDIPIDINDFERTELLLGKKVSLKYQIDRKEEKNTETLTSDMPGIDVVQEDKVVTTRLYAIDNVVISNVIAGNNKELFSVYSSLMKIPEGNQEHYLKQTAKYNKEYISSITPTKIRVVLDADYAKELKRAISNNYEIEIELLDDVDISSAEKADYYEKEVQLMNNFSSILK